MACLLLTYPKHQVNPEVFCIFSVFLQLIIQPYKKYPFAQYSESHTSITLYVMANGLLTSLTNSFKEEAGPLSQDTREKLAGSYTASCWQHDLKTCRPYLMVVILSCWWNTSQLKSGLKQNPFGQRHSNLFSKFIVLWKQFAPKTTCCSIWRHRAKLKISSFLPVVGTWTSLESSTSVTSHIP